MIVSRFRSATDTEPKQSETSWTQLAEALQRHLRTPHKESVALWSPVSYREGAKRGKAGVEAVFAHCADIDGGLTFEDVRDRLDELGLEYVAHSTYSDSSAHPKFRIVVPLASPVPAAEWPEVWQRIDHHLYRGLCDQATKDASRIYYLPSCPEDGEPWAHHQPGRHLDVAGLPEPTKPEPEPVPRDLVPEPGDDIPPWADYNARADWRDVFAGHRIRRHGDKFYITRPGKKAGISAVADESGPFGRVCTVFTTNWPGLNRGGHSPSSVHACLECGGDYREGARRLRKLGYGTQRPRYRLEPGGIADDGNLALEPAAEPEMLDPVIASDLQRSAMWAADAESRMRRVPEWGRWIVKTGHVWKPAEAGDGAALLDAARWHQEVADRQGPMDEVRAKLVKRFTGIQAVRNTVALGSQMPCIVVPGEQLDADPELLGVANGVLDVRTGQLVQAGSPMVTRSAGCAWDPDAACPEFERFLVTTYSDDEAIIRCVATLLALSLTARTDEQAFVVLLGDRGRNGKSVLLNVMHRLLGDYAAPVDKRLVVRGFGEPPRFSAAQLEGRRFAYASEASGRVRLDAEFVKAFSAGDPMYVERKGVDGYHMVPKAKLWLAVNSLPEADIDASLLSRAYLIPHTVSFYDPEDASYRSGDRAPDPHLIHKLEAELPGILAFLVRIYREVYLEHGLERPEAVRAAARRYESENDGVSLWLEEKCVLGPDERYRVGQAFEDYNRWAKAMNIGSFTRYNEFRKRLATVPEVSFMKVGNVSTARGIGPSDRGSAPYWSGLE